MPCDVRDIANGEAPGLKVEGYGSKECVVGMWTGGVYDLVEHFLMGMLWGHEEVVVRRIRLRYERLLVLGVDVGCHMMKVVGLMCPVYSECDP